MSDVILTGFMGTGKTTVGQLIGRRYGLQFIDTDAEVERRAGKSVAEIFQTAGEAEFRSLERQVLQELRVGSRRVIAVGGGTLIADGNVGLLRPDQAVYCLSCDPQVLSKRLQGMNDRPLLRDAGSDELVALLEHRRPAYERFTQVDTTNRRPTDVADEIAASAGLRRTATLDFHRDERCEIHFQEGLIDSAGSVMREGGLQGKLLLVTDSNVRRTGLVESVQRSAAEAGFACSVVSIPAGEAHKSLRSLEELYQACTRANLDRLDAIVAVGGGMIGDLAGVLAATYLRGLQLVLVPTTLLAQVDAAIGGKVAVDFDGAKNMIGAFYPARLTLVDPRALRELPPEVLRAGLAEIVKIGLMRSAELVGWLENFRQAEDILHHPEVIRRSIQEKVAVVQGDPYERGERMLLNFGHTVGHGVEAASSYTVSHGHAVGVGMAAELALSVERGWSDPVLIPRLNQMLGGFSLPTVCREIDPNQIMKNIRQDKKRHGAMFRIAVPTDAGRGAIFNVGSAEIKRAVDLALGAGT